jgi:hypothetical protein
VANDGVSVERSSVLPLLVLVVGLAAATVWLVALPLLDRSPRAERPCEVYVMPSGKVKCVPTSTGSSAAKKPKPKPARRAKRPRDDRPDR